MAYNYHIMNSFGINISTPPLRYYGELVSFEVTFIEGFADVSIGLEILGSNKHDTQTLLLSTSSTATTMNIQLCG